MTALTRKGKRAVAQYMRAEGYRLYDTRETGDGYEAEFYKTAAGITVATVIVRFNANWRCTGYEAYGRFSKI